MRNWTNLLAREMCHIEKMHKCGMYSYFEGLDCYPRGEDNIFDYLKEQLYTQYWGLVYVFFEKMKTFEERSGRDRSNKLIKQGIGG